MIHIRRSMYMQAFKLSFFTLSLLLILTTTALAFAQTPGPLPAPVTPISWPVAIVTTLSLVMGFVTQAVQTGSILGIVTVPKPWLPEVTLFGSFLGGSVSYLTSLGSSFVLNGSTVYYAVIAGVTALLAGAMPGLARQAHSIVPARMNAMKAAGADVAKGLSIIALTVGLLAGFGAVLSACTPAEQAAIAKAENTVLTDLENGSALAVIEAAVQAIFPAATGIDAIINDIIDELHNTGKLPPNIEPVATAMQTQLQAKIAAKNGAAK